MKALPAIQYRNIFILVATFWVLCLSPLADIHLEVNSNEKSYVHGQEHSETSLSMFIHELLFTHLQHTLDHITLGVSHQTLKKSKNLSSEGTVFSFYPQAVCASKSQTTDIHLLTSIVLLHDNKGVAGTYSREFSGLSPPTFLS